MSAATGLALLVLLSGMGWFRRDGGTSERAALLVGWLVAPSSTVVQPSEGADITEASVKAYLREHVAGYKVPRRVELATDLPREDSGKIFKRKLREPYWAEAGRQI